MVSVGCGRERRGCVEWQLGMVSEIKQRSETYKGGGLGCTRKEDHMSNVMHRCDRSKEKGNRHNTERAKKMVCDLTSELLLQIKPMEGLAAIKAFTMSTSPSAVCVIYKICEM